METHPAETTNLYEPQSEVVSRLLAQHIAIATV